MFLFPCENRGGLFPLGILRSLRSFPRPQPGETGGRRTWRPQPGRSRPGPDGTGAEQVGAAGARRRRWGSLVSPNPLTDPAAPGGGAVTASPRSPPGPRPGLPRCRRGRDDSAGKVGAAAQPRPRPQAASGRRGSEGTGPLGMWVLPEAAKEAWLRSGTGCARCCSSVLSSTGTRVVFRRRCMIRSLGFFLVLALEVAVLE